MSPVDTRSASAAICVNTVRAPVPMSTAPIETGKVLTAMVGWHVVIGIGEAVITALVVGAVVASRPDLVHGARHLSSSSDLEIRKAAA